MKKFALMMAIFVLALGSFGMAAAQDNGQNTVQATVNWDGTNLSLNPNQFEVGQRVQFAADFNNNGNNNQGNARSFAGYHLVIWQMDGEQVWRFNGAPAVMRSASDNFAFTFDQQGQYALALYRANEANPSADLDYNTADAASRAEFTVVAASGATQETQAQESQPAQAQDDQSAQVQAQTQAQDQGPQNLPTTGGESAPWLAIVMALGALLLVGGGALLVARPNR
jgi:LPXTG-motif cell wall-anchored protein